MLWKSKYGPFVALALLLACLPLAACAQAIPPAAGISSLVGERTYADHESIALTGGASIASALDWLEDFMEDEVGYVRVYTTDLLEMIPHARSNGAAVSLAEEQAVEGLFSDNAEIYTTLNAYRTKLAYCYERLGFLEEFIREPEVSGEYLSELQAEMAALRGEAAAHIGALAQKQASIIQAVADLQAAMTVPSLVEGIRQAALPTLRGTAATLVTAEQGPFAGNNEADIYVLSTKEIGVILTDKLQGATVKMWNVNDTQQTGAKTLTTDKDGAAIFFIADFKPNGNNEVTVAIEVTMAGKRTKKVESVKLEGAHGVVLKLEEDNGKPYFTMLCFNGKDILSEENVVYITAKNDAMQKLHFQLDTKGMDCTVTLKQGSWPSTVTHFTQSVPAGSADVLAQDRTWCRVFKPDIALVFEIAYPGGKETIKAKLLPKKPVFDEPLQADTNPVFLMPDLSLTLPSSIPVVGGGKLTFPLPFEKLKIYIDLDGNFFAGLGKIIVPDAASWKSKDMKDRLEYQQKLKKESIANKILYEAKTAWKDARARKAQFLGSTSATFSPYAYAVMRYDAKSHWTQGGAVVGINLIYSFEVTQSYMFGPVPGYIGFDMNASFGVGIELGVAFKYPGFTNWRLSQGSGLHVTFGVGIGVTAGAGIPKLAYVQLHGRFSTTIAMHLTATPSASPHIYVGLDLEVKLLFFSKSWTLVSWEYPEKLGDMQAMLIASAAQRLQSLSLDPMDITQFPTLEEMVATLMTEGLPAVSGQGTGIKPDKNIAEMSTLAGIDTNVRFIMTEDRCYALFIGAITNGIGSEATRLCWVNMNSDSRRPEFGYLTDKVIDRAGIFDYDFDVAYLKTAGNEERIVVTVQSGTRNGIRKLDANATDEEREAEMHKARLQTRLYSATFKTQKSTGELALENVYRIDIRISNVYYQMPRVVVLREPFMYKDSSGHDVGMAYTAVGCALILYDSDGKTPLRASSTNTFSLLDGRPTSSRYQSMAHVNLDTYSIDDIALLDFVVKGITEHHVPMVCILHGKKGAEDMVLVATDTMGSSSVDGFPHVKGSFNTMSPIRIAKQGSYQETTEGVFLLQNTKAVDQGKLSRVSALWIDGGSVRNGMAPKDVKITYRDYGLHIGADGLETTTVFWGTGKDADRQLYAYWPQSIEDDGVGGKRYELRAVLVDLKRQLITPSFSLLELEHLPLRAKIFSALATDEQVKCYYLGEARNSSSTYTRLYGVAFRYKAIVAMQSVVPEYPVIGTGDPLSLIASIKNEGDLVIDKIRLALYTVNDNKKFAEVTLDTTAFNHSLLMFDENGQPRAAAPRYAFSGTLDSVFRLPGVYDEYNCETVVTQDGDFGADGTLGSLRQQTESLKGLMPGNTEVYKIQLNDTPKNWKGNQKIRVEVMRINASFSLAGDTGQDGSVEFELDPRTGQVTQIVHDAVAGAAATGLGTDGMVGYGVPVGENGERLDSTVLDLSYNDQALAVTIQHFDEVPFAIINLSNYANDTAMDSQPVLTAYIDGRPVYTHTFSQPLSSAYGYILKVPLYQLTGGLPYEELEVRLSSLAEIANVGYREFSDVDNVRYLPSRAQFEIIGPESVVCYEGDNATFAVTVIGNTGPHTYQWFMRYPNGLVMLLEGETGPELTLENVQLSDDGKVFWCAVYDAYGNGLLSSEALLTVLIRTIPPLTGDGWPMEAIAGFTVCAAVLLAGYSVRKNKKRRAGDGA